MTTGTPADAGAGTVEDGKGTEDGTPDEPFLKTPTSVYKSAEEAAKGIAEKDRALQAAQTELAQLKQQQAQAETLGKLNESIDKLAQNAGNGDRQRELEEIAKKTREQLAEDPGAAYDLLQSTVASLDGEYAQRLAAQEKAIKEANDAKYAELQAEIARLKLESNPVYRENQDKIQEVRDKYGVPEEVAIQIVADQVQSSGEAADAPLGTTGTQVNTAAQQRKAVLDPEQRKILESIHGPLSDEEAKKLAAVGS